MSTELKLNLQNLKLQFLNTSVLLSNLFGKSMQMISEMEKSNNDIAADIALSAISHLSKLVTLLDMKEFKDLALRRIQDEDLSEVLRKDFDSILNQGKKLSHILNLEIGSSQNSKEEKEKIEKAKNRIVQNTQKLLSEFKGNEVNNSENLEKWGSFDDLSSMSALSEGEDDLKLPSLKAIGWKVIKEGDAVSSSSTDSFDDFTILRTNDINSGDETIKCGDYLDTLNAFFDQYGLEVTEEPLMKIPEMLNECCFALKSATEGICTSQDSPIMHFTTNKNGDRVFTEIKTKNKFRHQEYSDIVYSASRDQYIGYNSHNGTYFLICPVNGVQKLSFRRRAHGQASRKLEISKDGSVLVIAGESNTIIVLDIELVVIGDTNPVVAEFMAEGRITHFKVIESRNEELISILCLTEEGKVVVYSKNLSTGQVKESGISLENRNQQQVFETLAICPRSKTIAVASCKKSTTRRHSLYWLNLNSDLELNFVSCLPIHNTEYCSNIYALQFMKYQQGRPIFFAREYWTKETFLCFYFDPTEESIGTLRAPSPVIATNEYVRSLVNVDEQIWSIGRYGEIKKFQLRKL